MHMHVWEYMTRRRGWKCHCGEFISRGEFERRFGQAGNLDVDPESGLNQIASERRGPGKINDFRRKER